MAGGNGKKTLLFVGASNEALPAIKLARQLGLYVVASDMNPQAPGMLAADDQIVASTYDVAATVAAAKDFHQSRRSLDGVLCVATDVPLTVASVAAALDLPGIPVTSAQLAMDKLAMKERFAACGVAIPWYAPVATLSALEALVQQQGLPLVLKPADSRGSRGVVRLTEGVDLKWAFANAQEFSVTKRVMVEEYLAGPQVSTESIVINGELVTPGFSDRNYELLQKYAPHFIENGGSMPSVHAAAMRGRVDVLLQQAVASLGISNGIIKGDIAICDGQPFIIELAARLSGGYFCTHQIPLNVGVEPVRAAIQLALGEEVELSAFQPRCQHGVAQRCLFPEPGRVVSIAGVKQARALPGVAELVINVQPGDTVRPPTDSNAAAATVIAAAETRDQAIAQALAALEMIQIETEPI